MRIATARRGNGTTECVLIDEQRGSVSADVALGGTYPDALAVLSQYQEDELDALLTGLPDAAFESIDAMVLDAPYRHPRMIWGIGLNYVEHAADLKESAPGQAPASFIKADHTIIGPGESIPLPRQSARTTSEAELGVIIGKPCRNVSVEDALDYVWGYVPILDQTAEDILELNPRFLTRAKNFPGFFSFGPSILGARSFQRSHGDLDAAEVSTIHNGRVHRRNAISNMTFSPQHLISFHSEMMPLLPGDIISTGTPGAVVIHDGDSVTCEITGVGSLTNPVGRNPMLLTSQP